MLNMKNYLLLSLLPLLPKPKPTQPGRNQSTPLTDPSKTLKRRELSMLKKLKEELVNNFF
jgi:hypothetical protein